jgi:hypothetical protein
MPYYCQSCNRSIRGRIYETEKVINNSVFVCHHCSTKYLTKLDSNKDAPRFRLYYKNESENIKNRNNMPGYVSDSDPVKNNEEKKRRRNVRFNMDIKGDNKKSKQDNSTNMPESNKDDNESYQDEDYNDTNNNKNWSTKGRTSQNKTNSLDEGQGNNKGTEDEFKNLLDYLFGGANVNYIEIDPNKMPSHLKERGNKRKRKDQVEEHRDYKKRVIDYPFKWLGNDIKTIDDLINLGNSFDPKEEIRGNLNLFKLHKLVKPLQKLKDMVGLQEVKKIIFEEAIYFLQDLDEGNKEMLHTVIAGPPGVGKTQLAHIIADYYNALGFLKTNNVVSVKRNDLVAGYLGQSAIKTKKKLDEALGGVLLIDEAYSLGDTAGGKDSYSKEVIDLLTSYLSEHAHEFVCVIAGYKDALEDRFFSQNQGLARRFSKRYTITGYSGEELFEIFKTCVSKNNWKMSNKKIDKVKLSLFTDNQKIFKNFGGDMETLFNCCKKVHSKRLLCIETEDGLNDSKKKLNNNDVFQGIELFKNITDKNIEKNVHDICPYLYT